MSLALFASVLFGVSAAFATYASAQDQQQQVDISAGSTDDGGSGDGTEESDGTSGDGDEQGSGFRRW